MGLIFMFVDVVKTCVAFYILHLMSFLEKKKLIETFHSSENSPTAQLFSHILKIAVQTLCCKMILMFFHPYRVLILVENQTNKTKYTSLTHCRRNATGIR